jgi:hypothetical protein
MLAVTANRLLVARDARLVLYSPFAAILRIEFDVERGLPASMIIVPTDPALGPTVLAIANEHLTEAARAVALVGVRLDGPY